MIFLGDRQEPARIGFIGKTKQQLQAEALAKAANSSTAYSERYNRRLLNQKIYEKEYSSLEKARIKASVQRRLGTAQGPSLRKGFVSQLKEIGKEVSQKPLQPSQRRFIQPQPRRKPNFFEHKSYEEAYGSDELVFFDSQGKNRGSGNDTASLFGFG